MKEVKRTVFSRSLRSLGLRASDVREFSKIYGLRDSSAAIAVIRVGLRGKDIKALQSSERVSRKSAVRTATQYLTPGEVTNIKTLQHNTI